MKEHEGGEEETIQMEEMKEKEGSKGRIKEEEWTEEKAKKLEEGGKEDVSEMDERDEGVKEGRRNQGRDRRRRGTEVRKTSG